RGQKGLASTRALVRGSSPRLPGEGSMHSRARVGLALVVATTISADVRMGRVATWSIAPPAAQAAATPAQKCAAAELTLSAKTVTSSARCSQRAAAAGTGAPDMSCTTKVYQALNDRWAAIEAKGGCDPLSDLGGVTIQVGGLETGLYRSLGLT